VKELGMRYMPRLRVRGRSGEAGGAGGGALMAAARWRSRRLGPGRPRAPGSHVPGITTRSASRTDEAEPLAPLEAIAPGDSADDSPRHHSRDLAHRHPEVAVEELDLVSLVLRRRLLLIGCEEAPGSISDSRDHRAQRRTVDMDVEDREKRRLLAGRIGGGRSYVDHLSVGGETRS
jgi:hypothetical protein